MGKDTWPRTSLSPGKLVGPGSINDFKVFNHRRLLKSDPGLKSRHGDRPSSYILRETTTRPIQLSHGIRSHAGDGNSNLDNNAPQPPSALDKKNLQRALTKVSDLRDRLYGKRLQLRETRNELRQERSMLAETDANFRKSVRQFCEPNRNLKDKFEDRYHIDLEVYYRDLELQQNTVGSLQYQYDQDEDELDIGENELGIEEGRLKTLLCKFLDRDGDQVEENSSISSPADHLPPEELRYPTEDEAHLRIAEYQSRIGDARIMHERLADLLAEQGVRRDFAKLKEKVGWEPADVDEDFDQDFEELYLEIASELEIIQADIERLKAGLIDAGYWAPETAPPKHAAEILPLRSHSHRSQASSPAARKRAKSDSIVPLLQREISTSRVRRARVSQWILVTFGSSPVEQSRHKEMLRDLGQGAWGQSLDDKKWARLVFEHWDKDGSDSSSWDEVVPQDLLDYTAPANRASNPGDSILLPGILEAEKAVNGVEQQFHNDGDRYDHSTPYSPYALELDIHSEYESRSI